MCNSCDLTDCRPPGSSVRGILQARILEWIVIPFSRGSFWSRDQTWVCLLHCRQILYHLNSELMQIPHEAQFSRVRLSQMRAMWPLYLAACTPDSSQTGFKFKLKFGCHCLPNSGMGVLKDKQKERSQVKRAYSLQPYGYTSYQDFYFYFVSLYFQISP